MTNSIFRTFALVSTMSLGATLSACGGGGDVERGDGGKSTSEGARADIVIDGAKHHFPNVQCFEGFNKDLHVVLQNDESYFEVSQLQPSQSTWTVKYYKGSFDGEGDRMRKIDQADEYFTRKYDITRKGRKISGTAMAERGKLPRNPVDISINIMCQKL